MEIFVSSKLCVFRFTTGFRVLALALLYVNGWSELLTGGKWTNLHILLRNK